MRAWGKKIAWLLALGMVAALAWFWFGFGRATPGPFVPTAAELKKLAFYQQPESWFIANLQGPRETVDGQMLDPKMQYIAEQMRPMSAFMERTLPWIFATPPGRRWVRSSIDREWTLYAKVTTPMQRTEDRTIPGRDGPVPVRIYWPQTDDREVAGPLPILVYAHGGGWVFASVEALDRPVRLIANEAKSIVISVDYRRAPEHPYPAASDDVEDVFLWARANAPVLGGDSAHVGAGGDSAGGHAAINTTQRQLAAGKPVPNALLLYYPGAGLPHGDPSFEAFGKGYGLDASFIDYILRLEFPGLRDPAEADTLMDPRRAKNLQGFPPTIVGTAGFDILRDSGRDFAARLAADGVPVAYFNFGSLTHSFLQFSGVIADAERAATDTARLFGTAIRSGELPGDSDMGNALSASSEAAP